MSIALLNSKVTSLVPIVRLSFRDLASSSLLFCDGVDTDLVRIFWQTLQEKGVEEPKTPYALFLTASAFLPIQLTPEQCLQNWHKALMAA